MQVSPPNGISIGSAVAAQHTGVTRTQTLRVTYVARAFLKNEMELLTLLMRSWQCSVER